MVEQALYPAPASEVLVSGFNTDILRKDIQTLRDKNWLNDEVYNELYFLVCLLNAVISDH